MIPVLLIAELNKVFLSESEIPFYCKVVHKEKLEFTQKPENKEPGFFSCTDKKKALPPEREKGIAIILLPPVSPRQSYK